MTATYLAFVAVTLLALRAWYSVAAIRPDEPAGVPAASRDPFDAAADLYERGTITLDELERRCDAVIRAELVPPDGRRELRGSVDCVVVEYRP